MCDYNLSLNTIPQASSSIYIQKSSMEAIPYLNEYFLVFPIFLVFHIFKLFFPKFKWQHPAPRSKYTKSINYQLHLLWNDFSELARLRKTFTPITKKAYELYYVANLLIRMKPGHLRNVHYFVPPTIENNWRVRSVDAR